MMKNLIINKYNLNALKKTIPFITLTDKNTKTRLLYYLNLPEEIKLFKPQNLIKEMINNTIHCKIQEESKLSLTDNNQMRSKRVKEARITNLMIKAVQLRKGKKVKQWMTQQYQFLSVILNKIVLKLTFSQENHFQWFAQNLSRIRAHLSKHLLKLSLLQN